MIIFSNLKGLSEKKFNVGKEFVNLKISYSIYVVLGDFQSLILNSPFWSKIVIKAFTMV